MYIYTYIYTSVLTYEDNTIFIVLMTLVLPSLRHVVVPTFRHRVCRTEAPLLIVLPLVLTLSWKTATRCNTL